MLGQSYGYGSRNPSLFSKQPENVFLQKREYVKPQMFSTECMYAKKWIIFQYPTQTASGSAHSILILLTQNANGYREAFLSITPGVW